MELAKDHVQRRISVLEGPGSSETLLRGNLKFWSRPYEIHNIKFIYPIDLVPNYRSAQQN
jgi:hypothetical protein